MEHERLFALAREGVDDLRVAAGAERGRDQRLRFATREQRRTVRARQHARLDGDLADRVHVAAVDARLAGDDAATDDVVFEAAEFVGDLARLVLGAFAGGERLDQGLLEFADARVTRLLLGDLVRLDQFDFSLRRDGLGEVGIEFRRLPAPRRLGCLGGEFADRVDRDLHLLVAEHHGAEHDGFGQQFGFGLDHQHRVGRAGHDQVEVGDLHVLAVGVELVLAFDVADARSADRALERDARQRERSGRAEHRRDVGIDFRVERDDRRHHLHFIEEELGEQRADRAVDQARDQRLLLGRTAFALEEAARDAARGVRLLDVVDGQREEILARLRFATADGGDEHHGVAHGNEDGAVGLAGETAGFDRNGVGTVLEAGLVDVHGGRCPIWCDGPTKGENESGPHSGPETGATVSGAGRAVRRLPDNATGRCPSGSRAVCGAA